MTIRTATAGSSASACRTRPRRTGYSTSRRTSRFSPTHERRFDRAHPGAGAEMTQAHPFLGLTDSDREEMLATIGVSSVDELFRDIPQGVRLQRELDLEPALSEHAVFAHLAELASRNVPMGG